MIFYDFISLSNRYFRFVIAPNVAYEIIVEFWSKDTPIETARGSLCIVGEWGNKDSSDTIEREWILKEQPIQYLLEAAVKDYLENNK